MKESPAFGQVRNGQIIKRVNGQSVVGLKRDEVRELLDIDEEDVILDIME